MDLTTVVPTSEVSMHTDLRATMEAGGQCQPMTMTMDMEMSFGLP